MREICSKRIMFAAPGSGSGKTTLTCAFLQVLKEKYGDVAAFKCGPDYIDPLFHRNILGIESKNLDVFFEGEDGAKRSLADFGEGYAVLEGVMGIYDGTTVDDVSGSCYEIAELTQTPIVLVVDALGVGRTVISVIKGVLSDDKKELIKGVILNRTSEVFFNKLKPVMESELSAVRPDVKFLGFFPKTDGVKIDSRHLGLMLPNEIADLKNKISLAADLMKKNTDVDGLIGIMESAGRVGVSSEETGLADHSDGSGLTLAVALDEAFCFYYSDNIDLFKSCGVNIKFFSPLSDESLPKDCDGILLGGGYPENHLLRLSQNTSMLESVRKAIERGIPSLAECGGFMYLHGSVSDINGKAYELAGVIDGECRYTGHLVRFGYMEIERSNRQTDDEGFFGALNGMRGHEFHYYESTAAGHAFTAGKPHGDKKWDCMIAGNNGLWGFPHFYYNSKPQFIMEFIRKMREVKDGKLL